MYGLPYIRRVSQPTLHDEGSSVYPYQGETSQSARGLGGHSLSHEKMKRGRGSYPFRGSAPPPAEVQARTHALAALKTRQLAHGVGTVASPHSNRGTGRQKDESCPMVNMTDSCLLWGATDEHTRVAPHQTRIRDLTQGRKKMGFQNCASTNSKNQQPFAALAGGIHGKILPPLPKDFESFMAGVIHGKIPPPSQKKMKAS